MSDVEAAQKVYETYLTVDNFIKTLMENENLGANEYTFDLKNKKDYENLLKPVIKIYLDNDRDIKKSFEAIFEQSKISELLKKFILDNKMAPGAGDSSGYEKTSGNIIFGKSAGSC